MKWWSLIFILLPGVVNGSVLEFLGLKATKPPPPLNTSSTIEQFPALEKLELPTPNKPQLIQLNGPIRAGQVLHIVGEFKEDSLNRLQLDFLVNSTSILWSLSTKPHNFSSNPNILASIFEVNFPNGTILNDTVPSPLIVSKAFDFRVRFLERHIQVFANQGEIGIYERLEFFESAKTIRLTGSIKSLSMFRLEGSKYPNPFTKQITLGNSSRLDITAHPIPNILDQSKMRNYLPGEGWVDLNQQSKDLSFGHGKFNYSVFLYRRYGVYDLRELAKDYWGNGTTGYGMLLNRNKRRSSKTSSRGHSGSRGSFSSKSSSGSSHSSSWGWGSSSRGYHGSRSSHGSGGSWFNWGGSSDDHHYVEPPWYGRTDRHAYLYVAGEKSRNKPPSPQQRLGTWKPFPGGGATVGYMYNARTPSYSYRYGGQTHFQQTCGDCSYYCEGCCKFCDETRISFHNRRSSSTADPSKMPLSERFDVTFYNATDSPKFQISIRLVEGVIVRNTFHSGKWENEERDGGLPIDGWRIFEMTIMHSDHALTIYFGGRKFADFRHREATRSLAKVKIDGDLEIHKVVLDGKLIEAA